MIKNFQKETKSISRSVNVNNLYQKTEILRKIMNIHEYANDLISIILLQFKDQFTRLHLIPGRL
jgi:hypothetical protein